MSKMASQITGVTIVYSNVCLGADHRKHQNSASLAFVRGIHRWPVNSPHKGPVRRKMFQFDDVIMHQIENELAAIRLHISLQLTKMFLFIYSKNQHIQWQPVGMCGWPVVQIDYLQYIPKIMNMVCALLCFSSFGTAAFTHILRFKNIYSTTTGKQSCNCMSLPIRHITQLWRRYYVKRRHFDVVTSKWRRFDVISTLLLRHVFSGFWSVTSLTMGQSFNFSIGNKGTLTNIGKYIYIYTYIMWTHKIDDMY